MQQLPVSNNHLSLVSPTSTSLFNYAATTSRNTTNTTAFSSISAQNLLILNPSNNAMAASMSHNPPGHRATGSPGSPHCFRTVPVGIPLIPHNDSIPLQQRERPQHNEEHNVFNVPPQKTVIFRVRCLPSLRCKLDGQRITL